MSIARPFGIALLLACAALLAVSGSAYSDPRARADRLFAEALDLEAAERYDAAALRFESFVAMEKQQSPARIDALKNALQWSGDCYVAIGGYDSAVLRYLAALAYARQIGRNEPLPDGNPRNYSSNPKNYPSRPKGKSASIPILEALAQAYTLKGDRQSAAAARLEVIKLNVNQD